MFSEVITPQHIRTVARLAREIWNEHYIPIIGKAQTEYMVEKFQSAAVIKHQIEMEDYLYFLIEPEKTPEGYLSVQSRKEDLFLSKIYLRRIQRGLGFGRRAAGFVEELAKDLGKPAITLTVNKHNSDSIAAYSRWGFRIIDEVVTDIGSGFVMDDYVMQKPVEAVN